MTSFPLTSNSPPAAQVVGRLAPSPTGNLHLGNARSFLLAWWSARSQAGRVVLRIEDVDVTRASQEAIDGVRRDLTWLGVDWDEERLQSTGMAHLKDAVAELVERDLAYPCVCTRGDLRRYAAEQSAGQSAPRVEAPGAPQGPGEEFRYPGLCRGRFHSVEQAERDTGKQAGVRLIAPDRELVFVDRLHGEQRFNVQQSVGDFMILRRDKLPSYQLAVTVDDATDRVTEVLRGDDLLSSTARQILVQEALRLSPVSYAHLPLVCSEEGRRLAKRDLDLGLTQLREQGVAPSAIVRWALDTCGHDGLGGPHPSASDALVDFQLSRTPLQPTWLRGDEFGPESPRD